MVGQGLTVIFSEKKEAKSSPFWKLQFIHLGYWERGWNGGGGGGGEIVSCKPMLLFNTISPGFASHWMATEFGPEFRLPLMNCSSLGSFHIIASYSIQEYELFPKLSATLEFTNWKEIAMEIIWHYGTVSEVAQISLKASYMSGEDAEVGHLSGCKAWYQGLCGW